MAWKSSSPPTSMIRSISRTVSSLVSTPADSASSCWAADSGSRMLIDCSCVSRSRSSIAASW